MRHEWDLIPGEPAGRMRNRVAQDLSRLLEGKEASAILEHLYYMFERRLALVSSFGAESVALLHLVSEIDTGLPVLFIDTQMLFEETIAYQDQLADRLGLTDIRRISADDVVLRLADGQNDLHQIEPDSCCHLRKTIPLQTELLGFQAWITGRKRHQTSQRADMSIVEVDDEGRIKVNPLANWSSQDVNEYIELHDLPRHPLVEKGFRSIGCAPCTTAVKPGEDPRAGRWRNTEKTECGIHFDADGKIIRNTPKVA